MANTDSNGAGLAFAGCRGGPDVAEAAWPDRLGRHARGHCDLLAGVRSPLAADLIRMADNDFPASTTLGHLGHHMCQLFGDRIPRQWRTTAGLQFLSVRPWMCVRSVGAGLACRCPRLCSNLVLWLVFRDCEDDRHAYWVDSHAAVSSAQ